MKIVSWFKTSIIFLLIATSLGAFLRYMFVDPVSGVNFKYLLHTHSHLAFLGWVFNALYAGLLYSFLPDDFERARKYNVLFWCFVFAVAGMMLSFPFQGYGVVSIAFSTLHVFLSWIFVWFFIKDTVEHYQKKPLSLQFAYCSLFFLIISSIGPFVLGYLMAKDIPGPYSELAIYFYLHLQYDGWFTFAIFALLYRYLEKKGINFNIRSARVFFWVFAVCCLPAYASSTLWTTPPNYVYMTALIASILQVFALVFFINSIRKIRKELKEKIGPIAFNLIAFALTCFILKNILQLIGVEPDLASRIYHVRNFLIAYLHLIFIGFVTIFLLGYMHLINMWQMPVFLLSLIVVAFISSELLLFLQPFLAMNFSIVIPGYFLLLFIISLLIPISLLISAFWILKKSTYLS